MKKDKVVPKNKWKFNNDVTSVFEDMLKRSIPQYDVMRKLCFDIGSKFVQRDTDITDIGCSRGDALAPFSEKFPDNTIYGLEISDAMFKLARKRFGVEGNVAIYKHDLRLGIPSVPTKSSVILSVLTIQFVPIEYRQRLIQDIYDKLVDGGAFIFVEKVLGSDAKIDKTMVDLYYNLKGENGYTQEQIERKRLSLEGVLVPVTAKWNEELLKMAGFTQVDCFWRCLNFAGWVAVK